MVVQSKDQATETEYWQRVHAVCVEDDLSWEDNLSWDTGTQHQVEWTQDAGWSECDWGVSNDDWCAQAEWWQNASNVLLKTLRDYLRLQAEWPSLGALPRTKSRASKTLIAPTKPPRGKRTRGQIIASQMKSKQEWEDRVMPPASEETWIKREGKRQYAVLNIQAEDDHHKYLWTADYVLNDPQYSEVVIPRAPDPLDRSISKRNFEKAVQKYRRELQGYVKAVETSSFLKQIINEKLPAWRATYKEKKFALWEQFGLFFDDNINCSKAFLSAV